MNQQQRVERVSSDVACRSGHPLEWMAGQDTMTNITCQNFFIFHLRGSTEEFAGDLFTNRIRGKQDPFVNILSTISRFKSN